MIMIDSADPINNQVGKGFYTGYNPKKQNSVNLIPGSIGTSWFRPLEVQLSATYRCSEDRAEATLAEFWNQT